MLLTRLFIGERGKGTGVLQVTVNGGNATAITDEANAIVASYMRLRTARAQEEAGRMLQFLRQELPSLQGEVSRSESAVVDFQSSQGTFEPSREAQTYLSGGLELDRQLAALQVQRQQLLHKFMPGTQDVKAVDDQIASLLAMKEQFNDQYKGLPDVQREAAALQRDAKVNSEIYLSLLNKMQELSVSEAGAVGGAHTVDLATVPTRPTSPKTGPVLAGGLLLGLFAGIVSALVRERYIRGLTHPEIVERESHLPVLAAIPLSRRRFGAIASAVRDSGTRRRIGHSQAAQTLHSDTGNSTGRPVELLALTDPFDDSVESLRGLRETLLFELAETNTHTLVVTSPAPYDGKSFISANLAALIAESGKRVLLIDGDLRRGNLAERLGLPSSSGMLARQLLDPAHHDDLAQATCVPNLYLLNAAEHLQNPSSVLTMDRFGNVLSTYQNKYDFIVVDTPPLLAVPDAAVIASVAGATLVVVRAGVHSAEDITQSLTKLRRARARVTGVVLNGTSRRLRHKNGTYDYAHAYSYR
jgi:tyrosine-protein kinase Etk/Wzc